MNPTGVLIKRGGEAHKEGGCGKREVTPGSDRKTKGKKKNTHSRNEKVFTAVIGWKAVWSLNPKVIV